MKSSSKLWGGALTLVIGVATVALFQNCAGDLPSGLDQASTTGAAAAAVVLPLSIYPSNQAVTAGTTLYLTVSGGSGTYTFTPAGTVVLDPLLNTYVFTAPATGPVVITVSDGTTTKSTDPITINAATVVTPPPAAAPPILIYQYYNASIQKHAMAPASPGTTEVGSQVGPVYYLMPDNTTGGVPFYRCRYIQNGQLSFFDTTSSNCEGTGSPWTQLGFIYSSNTNGTVPNTKPLYRMTAVQSSPAGGTVLDYVDAWNPATLPGYTTDPNVLGYIPNL